MLIQIFTKNARDDEKIFTQKRLMTTFISLHSENFTDSVKDAHYVQNVCCLLLKSLKIIL